MSWSENDRKRRKLRQAIGHLLGAMQRLNLAEERLDEAAEVFKQRLSDEHRRAFGDLNDRVTAAVKSVQRALLQPGGRKGAP